MLDKLATDFKAKDSYLQTDLFRGDEVTLITKSTQEAQAGQQTCDLIESTITTIRVLEGADILTPYYSPAVASYPDTYKTPADGGLVASATDRIDFASFGYNTETVPASAVPKTLDDLLNPGLSGKIGLAGSSTGRRWLGSVLKEMRDERGREFLARFESQQKPRIHQMSGTALLDLVAKGEVGASPATFEADAMRQARAHGAPVGWVPLAPVLANSGQVGIAAKARHPYAAMLFADYLLGDGQQIIAESGYHVAGQDVPYPLFIPEQGRTLAQIESDAKLWEDLFRQLGRS